MTLLQSIEFLVEFRLQVSRLVFMNNIPFHISVDQRDDFWKKHGSLIFIGRSAQFSYGVAHGATIIAIP
jgi:hypothetical protein